ncbi:hypothetical protein R3P38DRAFT_2982281 [Favolaschia claudopus]|uniref:DUF6534 domain-containing protein n=1 Tax=Favolaschia claudopus TaxID=2862362 RepID=A0AAW0AYE3_9AGAR
MAATDGSPQGLPGPNFELTFAPLFFGVILNALLFGVFIVQVHSYFRVYKNDHAYIRYLIYYLIVMEIINTICDVATIYEPLIKLHNVNTNKSPTFIAADPIVTTLISTPVQLFLAWRIRQVTKSNWLAGVVALLAFTSLAGGVAATMAVASHSTFAEFRFAELPLTLWLTSTAFADLFITAFLVNFLWVNKTGFKTQTDSVADKIIFLTVQTGMVTSVAAIADVTLFLLDPKTTFFFIWDFCLSKMYSICLISTLNARADWNNLLSAAQAGDAKQKDPNAIIKVRRATDIQGLQLYIPSQFEFNNTADAINTHTNTVTSPLRRKRTFTSTMTPRPGAEWIPQPRPLPPAPTRGGNHPASSTTNSNTKVARSDTMSESARRTAAWAMAVGR